LTELNKTLSHAEAAQYPPLSLAFLGDSVYEQLVRTELILTANMPAGKLHSMAVKLVCATYQSKASHFLCDGIFNEQEEYIFKRGRNAHGINAPKSAKNSDYRAATGLEAVFGYLALTGQQKRCEELYTIIRNNIKE
jgi:ribonuclease-3 family protein